LTVSFEDQLIHTKEEASGVLMSAANLKLSAIPEHILVEEFSEGYQHKLDNKLKRELDLLQKHYEIKANQAAARTEASVNTIQKLFSKLRSKTESGAEAATPAVKRVRSSSAPLSLAILE
jgi:hypothetical protein